MLCLSACLPIRFLSQWDNCYGRTELLSTVCDDGWADGDVFMKYGADGVREYFQEQKFQRIKQKC
jgi:hypothetical protein